MRFNRSRQHARAQMHPRSRCAPAADAPQQQMRSGRVSTHAANAPQKQIHRGMRPPHGGVQQMHHGGAADAPRTVIEPKDYPLPQETAYVGCAREGWAARC
jgi:hypothetical protein